MKIKKIHINNVLSYDNETIELNNDLNIIIGANGSGKSNLMNIIIYLIKRYCFRNYEISNMYNSETIEIKRYSISQKNPLYDSSEDYFLQKHKNKKTEESLIDLNILFEDNDIANLHEIKNKEELICHFLEKSVDSISFMEDKFHVDKNEVKKIFNVEDDDLCVGKELELKVRETEEGWKIENDNEKYFIYMKYFSLILEILNLINIEHSIKSPFVFFEAYRNNSIETTKVGITEFDNQSYSNLTSWKNLLSLNYSIGTNSTYIMLATKKYGKLMRNAIEKENGLKEFYSSLDYIRLKNFFKNFEYDINLKCLSPENNIYQFYLIKEELEIEIDAISSGEREIINFIFGLFLEDLNDGIVIIDEPELHLHPNWQKKLIQILKKETKDKNIQIFFVTHSSSFISYNILNNIYRIYKKNGFSKFVRINDLLQNDEEDSFRKNLSVINATNNEKIFFANNVILVEGITDEILFKKIYETELGKIPDGLEFVSISGKNNLDKFSAVLNKLKINYFYIGDYDNVYDNDELKSLFSIDYNGQQKDLKKKKNQTYAVLDLLKSIEKIVNDNNDKNFENLKMNYHLYNDRFVKIKPNISDENQQKIIDFIKEKYNDNIYILRKGEIEDYLGTGTSSKTVGFNRVISFLNDEAKYKEFIASEDFKELKYIINDIGSKIEGDHNE